MLYLWQNCWFGEFHREINKKNGLETGAIAFAENFNRHPKGWNLWVLNCNEKGQYWQEEL